MRRWIPLAVLALASASLPAQQTSRPPAGAVPPNVQALLQQSGLTIDQIRSRLRAQGISENVLDAYYTGRTAAAPDSNAFAALRALGLDVPAMDTARTAMSEDAERAIAVRDSMAIERAFMDTVARLVKDDSARTAVLEMLRSRDSQREQLDLGYELFGQSVFARGNTLFNPSDIGPVPPEYRLGPGDELVLILTGDTERAHDLTVTREGMVFIPNVGGVAVANLTMQQLEDVLWNRLGRVYSGIRRGSNATAHFQITVSKLGTSQVSVLGDVTRPGSYRISKLGTVLTALYAASGPTDGGSMRRVEVRRGGRTFATLDVYDYLVSGNATNDVRLESGDIVFVPPRGPRARVSGAVIRPATYELRAGESLGDLLRMAGGFRAEADRRRVQVQRILPPDQRVASGSDRMLFDVASASLESSSEPLFSGDVVIVAEVARRLANEVTVTGNVWSPGAVALTPGMRVSDALARAGGIQPDTYLDALQVTRLEPDSTRRMLRLRLPARGDSSDIVLRADDEIRVFGMSEYRPARYVSVSGAVRQPGRFLFRDGMTIRDLLMLAGGVQEGALLTEAEVARMPDNRSDGTTAATIRVPLDSSYLFDRRPSAAYLGPPGVATLATGAPEVTLKAYDNLLILRQPDWFLPRTVRLTGEVRYPGTYTLRSKGERLSDLVGRAGGLTPDAYPEGIVFVRAQDNTGRIGVDLPTALRRRDHVDNLLLVDQDSVHIPVKAAVVMVTGAVNSPVAVPFVRGQNIEYYVYAAGGPTARADVGKAFVIQPSGKVESVRRRALYVTRPDPQPGSTVSVPEKLEQTRFDLGATITSTTSILTSIVALIAILGNNR